MATLILKSEDSGERVIRLRLGINRVGRCPSNDLQIEHPSVSARHCELQMAGDAVLVRDCGSTNGTYIEGQPIESGTLHTGQTLRLGDVELVAEATEVTVAIPRFEGPRVQAPPISLNNGLMMCPRHEHVPSTHRCTHCLEIMCDACVTRLGRRGGKVLLLCPKCSHRCERIAAKPKRKKGLLGFLHNTIKLPLGGCRREVEVEVG
jgi:hypothetical protein